MNGKPVTTLDVGKKICEALGIDGKKVTDLTIRFKPGELVHARVEYLDNDAVDGLIDCLQDYVLVPLEPAAKKDDGETPS